jgi:hypothetical protein
MLLLFRSEMQRLVECPSKDPRNRDDLSDVR